MRMTGAMEKATGVFDTARVGAAVVAAGRDD
jgi:hypothetical protein